MIVLVYLFFIRSVTHYKNYHNNNINYHMTRNTIFSVVIGYVYLITFSFYFFDTISYTNLMAGH
jgi:hypothetical protein